jgi:hypothetical protein
MRNSINVVAIVGFVLGGALGMVGAMVTQQNLQAILCAIDAAGIVSASALLALKYFRLGNDVVADGFLEFAIGVGSFCRVLSRGLGRVEYYKLDRTAVARILRRWKAGLSLKDVKSTSEFRAG